MTQYNTNIVLAYFEECGLPPCAMEYRFHPTRKWRFDFSWPEYRVALEVEGGVWTRGAHGRGTGIVRDIKKYNAATIRGWRVLRCLPKDLLTRATADMVRATIGIARVTWR